MPHVTRAIALSQPTTPPTSFRLFKAGRNETTKGTFLFDAAAARSVMAAYRKHGVLLPIDLEHLSVSGDSPRTDALDARGWFKLELRGGDLWAVDVKWTPDGAARLANRTQRYISPCFMHDAEGRVTEIVNVALVAMPATHEAPELVAASKYGVVVSSRVAIELRAQLYREAARRGVTASNLIATLLRKTALASDDSTKALDKLIAALGLPPDANADQIKKAVDALLAAVGGGDAGADPLASNPDPAPPVAALNAIERAAADSIQAPAKRAKFISLRAQRASERLEQTKPIKKAGK